MINCENHIQRMVSLYFNKVYVISVTKIEEIAYAIHKGFSRRRLCEKYARRKVNNVPEVNFRCNFAFARTTSLFIVIT